jgi:hypothetical protein
MDFELSVKIRVVSHGDSLSPAAGISSVPPALQQAHMQLCFLNLHPKPPGTDAIAANAARGACGTQGFIVGISGSSWDGVFRPRTFRQKRCHCRPRHGVHRHFRTAAGVWDALRAQNCDPPVVLGSSGRAIIISNTPF